MNPGMGIIPKVLSEWKLQGTTIAFDISEARKSAGAVIAKLSERCTLAVFGLDVPRDHNFAEY